MIWRRRSPTAGACWLPTQCDAADSTARMKFLSFEREFLPLLGKGDIKGMRVLTERLGADLEATAARSPPTPSMGRPTACWLSASCPNSPASLSISVCCRWNTPRIEAGTGTAQT